MRCLRKTHTYTPLTEEHRCYSEVLAYFFNHDDLVLMYRTVSDLVSMRDPCVMFQWIICKNYTEKMWLRYCLACKMNACFVSRNKVLLLKWLAFVVVVFNGLSTQNRRWRRHACNKLHARGKNMFKCLGKTSVFHTRVDFGQVGRKHQIYTF